MKYKIEFGFGAGEDASGRLLLQSEVIIGLQKIRKRAVEWFDGYTLTKTQGGWVNPANHWLIEEPGYTLSVLVDPASEHNKDAGYSLEITDMVLTIKQALRQQAVAVMLTPVDWSIR